MQQAASTYAVVTAMYGKNFRLPSQWPGETFEELWHQTLKAELSKNFFPNSF